MVVIVQQPNRLLMGRVRIAAASLILLSLLCVPAPLLPPHRLAGALQSLLGIGFKAAYLAAAVGLQTVFYLSLGWLATLVATRASSLRGPLLQIGTVPLVVVGLALIIRSLKAGHLPIWVNAVVPITACVFGVLLGFALQYRYWKTTLSIGMALVAFALWGLVSGTSTSLRNATEVQLQKLVAAGPSLPSGDARFGALLQAAFEPARNDVVNGNAVQHNRAAILAWGVAIGHPQLARFIGLDPDSELVRSAARLQPGTTLRGREDWPRHYALSAALAVLEHPLVSDAGGLMKEQLDALTMGSGFSFGDLAADRAGVRFASAATGDETAATSMQARLKKGFEADEFFPPTIVFPENLTVDQFRNDFGGVGSKPYRLEVTKIEKLLDGCIALK
jgi:hypothetical protein